MCLKIKLESIDTEISLSDARLLYEELDALFGKSDNNPYRPLEYPYDDPNRRFWVDPCNPTYTHYPIITSKLSCGHLVIEEE